MISDYQRQIQLGLNPEQRLYQIIEHTMCIGCGICQSIAGPRTIRMELMENGYFRPVVRGEFSHAEMDKIMNICPGTRVEGMPDSEINGQSLFDKVWGVWREI